MAQIRGELQDSYGIAVSADAIEDAISRYQAIVAAREQDPELLAAAYRDVEEVVLDGRVRRQLRFGAGGR